MTKQLAPNDCLISPLKKLISLEGFYLWRSLFFDLSKNTLQTPQGAVRRNGGGAGGQGRCPGMSLAVCIQEIPSSCGGHSFPPFLTFLERVG